MPLNTARYKKSVSSILYLQLALVTCYIPSGIVMVVLANNCRRGSRILKRGVNFCNNVIEPKPG